MKLTDLSPRSLLFVVLAVALEMPMSAAGTEIPRTPSGKPDLSGHYDISTLTPLQRKPEQGNRRVMTDEEVAAIAGRVVRGLEAQAKKSDPDRGAPPVGANVGGYNAFWLDRGTAPVVVDGEYRTSLLIDPPNGRLPPLTERGRSRVEGLHTYNKPSSGEAYWLGKDNGPFDGPESLSTLDRCLFHPEATIPVQPRAYNNMKRIIQTETHVLLMIEWMHHARIVRLDSEDPADAVPSRAGDSIGWWEGDTLVVDTVDFLEEEWLASSITGQASFTADAHIVERFTLLDGDTLLYQFRVESSDYEAPYGGEFTWPRTGDRLYEYACHEGNYAMGNILRGARLLEREAISSSGASDGE